ncbi:MAG: adenylosuccinate synthetase, partial [Clostridia bacterium]|nr:adenylosuccinate synthetase [Clostridia bacterium]
KYAARVNGFDYLALTKLDVLDGFEKIRICVAYEYNGQIIQNFPLRLDVQQRCRPVWEEMPGWKEDISGARSYRDLPVQARRYVERLEELSGVKVALIGVGADREEIIVKEPEFLGF